jgi:hypothetical protein
MRKADEPVQEVTCSETGKPMTKIPLWMADVKVKFISDEARQKHPALPGLTDIEPLRRNVPDIDGLKDLDAAGAVIQEDHDPEFDEIEAEVEPEEPAEEEFEA